MIKKISNPGQSATNSVVVINTTACCGGTCVECEYSLTIKTIGGVTLSFVFNNSVGIEKTLTIPNTVDESVVRTALVDFLQSIGYYVENPMTDIEIVFVGDDIEIAFYGCAEFIGAYLDSEPITLAQKFCNFDPVCDYYFETDGNGASTVPVSKNGTADTLAAFTIADSAATVKAIVEAFFTTSTVTVVKNTDAGVFEITVTGAPEDLLFIDGEQDIKSNCRKIYKV
jgi:hypothetical protein